MTSKITSRAACLSELTSNPKSFFNCPDMHGGLGLPEGSFRSGEMDPETLKAESCRRAANRNHGNKLDELAGV
jgi:hypothetical protein